MFDANKVHILVHVGKLSQCHQATYIMKMIHPPKSQLTDTMNKQHSYSNIEDFEIL